jgi:hypothetical protein
VARTHKFKFVVLGRYLARIKGNESAVTVNCLAGTEGHLVHAGTLTMTEAEWETLYTALERALPGDVEIDDRTIPTDARGAMPSDERPQDRRER